MKQIVFLVALGDEGMGRELYFGIQHFAGSENIVGWLTDSVDKFKQTTKSVSHATIFFSFKRYSLP